MRGLPDFSASLFFYSIWLRSGLLSERIRDGVYSAGHPAHAHHSLYMHSESLASRKRLKNVLKTSFLNVSYWGRTYFVRASIALVVKPRTYLCSLCFCTLFHFILFSFYFSISFLIELSMTSDILSYLLIFCESSI